MTTLNLIAENIAFKLGKQFDQTLLESIKDTVLNYRAKFIRDDLERNSLSEIHFSQVLTINFEEVNLMTEFHADLSCISAICDDVLTQTKYKILKSTTKLPLPIRGKASGKSPFYYVGTIDGMKQFVYTTLNKYVYYKTLPYNHKTIYYTIINEYVYILNNLDACSVTNNIIDGLGICNAMIKSVFEDPREAYSLCSDKSLFIDDRSFPISKDMLMQISNNILKGEYPLVPKDGQQVNIEPDDND